MTAAAASAGTVGVLPPRAWANEVRKLPTEIASGMLAIGGDTTRAAGAGDAITALTAAAGRGETSWAAPVTVWSPSGTIAASATSAFGRSGIRIGESGRPGAEVRTSAGDIAIAGWNAVAMSGTDGYSAVVAAVGPSPAARRLAALAGGDFVAGADGASAVSPGAVTAAVRDALRFC